MKGLEIDFETADRITVLNLKEHLNYLQDELSAHEAGAWMHPEDVLSSKQDLIPALKLLIAHWGG